jgi:hypothetical protein
MGCDRRVVSGRRALLWVVPEDGRSRVGLREERMNSITFNFFTAYPIPFDEKLRYSRVAF